MMQNYIHSLFPTPLFETILDTNSIKQEIEDCLFKIKSNKYELRTNDGNNLISVDSYVLDQWNLKETKKKILDSLNLFARQALGYRYENIYITQSWVNVNPYMTSHSMHHHKNSLFSGVMYFDVSDDCGDIRFHKEESILEPEVEFDEENEFTWSYRYFTPKKYQLLIFPSHLKLSVSSNNDKEVNRVSLAFNTFLTNFGSENRRTFLSTTNHDYY